MAAMPCDGGELCESSTRTLASVAHAARSIDVSLAWSHIDVEIAPKRTGRATILEHSSSTQRLPTTAQQPRMSESECVCVRMSIDSTATQLSCASTRAASAICEICCSTATIASANDVSSERRCIVTRSAWSAPSPTTMRTLRAVPANCGGAREKFF